MTNVDLSPGYFSHIIHGNGRVVKHREGLGALLMRITSGRLKMDVGEWETHSNNILDFTIPGVPLPGRTPNVHKTSSLTGKKKLAPRFSVHACVAGGTLP